MLKCPTVSFMFHSCVHIFTLFTHFSHMFHTCYMLIIKYVSFVTCVTFVTYKLDTIQHAGHDIQMRQTFHMHVRDMSNLKHLLIKQTLDESHVPHAQTCHTVWLCFSMRLLFALKVSTYSYKLTFFFFFFFFFFIFSF
jgi:hypothetical protein